MFMSHRSPGRPTFARARRVLCITVAIAGLGGLASSNASATQHDYCLWDGGYCSNSAWTLYFASGLNYITTNYAYLPYAPGSPTIYCGAHDAVGNQYASYTSGNPSCTHPYSGGNPLKADEYVSVAATTHGFIYY
jgi:hypothetical protein